MKVPKAKIPRGPAHISFDSGSPCRNGYEDSKQDPQPPSLYTICLIYTVCLIYSLSYIHSLSYLQPLYSQPPCLTYAICLTYTVCLNTYPVNPVVRDLDQLCGRWVL